jgi:AcrR family transcriptional regulator
VTGPAALRPRRTIARVVTPAFQRLDVDERRRRLLELGARLFTSHTYTELSMARIAREAGISKALLYHYFPSKQEFFRATLTQAADELQARIEPDPRLAPFEQLTHSLDAYLEWIDEHREAYVKLLHTAQTVDEIRAIVEEQRARTTRRVLTGVVGRGRPVPPQARVAVRGWLWFMDGACLDWIEHGDVDRKALRGLLLATLVGALAAGEEPLRYRT